jgi:DNA-binding response OmpR family regulator
MTKIMIVDDEPDIVYVVKMMLEKEDYEVIEAYSGEECLEKLRREKPALVLLDVLMPDLDGWEVCKKIKEELKTTLVVMLTVKSRDKDKLKSFDDAGADWHINKPFERERLTRTVRWLLSGPMKRR